MSLLIAGTALPLCAQNIPYQQAQPAENFVDTSGIGTHLNYTDTSYYTAWPQVYSALVESGVKHIRDGYWTLQGPNDPVALEHQQLARAGITTDYVIPYGTYLPPSTLQTFAATVQDMEAIEGPNECDVSGACGGNGIADSIAYQPTVLAAGQAAGVPVLGPAYAQQYSYPIAGNIAPLMNLNSMHLYFAGRNPGSTGWGSPDAEGHAYGSFDYWYDMSEIDAPGMVPAISETGYVSFPTVSAQCLLPESVAESYTLRTLLLAFKHGYQETFFYQLVDDPTSPQGYGLLNDDFSPKPSFTGLSNLLNLLSDSGGNFQAGSLQYQILGGDSNVNQLLLQKSDGSYWLALWLEEPTWDPVNIAPITVNPENIGIQLGPGYTTQTDYQFNNTGNYVPFNQPMYGNISGLTVTTEVSLIKIVPE